VIDKGLSVIGQHLVTVWRRSEWLEPWGAVKTQAVMTTFEGTLMPRQLFRFTAQQNDSSGWNFKGSINGGFMKFGY
jgi:hypothetical protein